ncbi:MAG: hypothetical protein BJ554DRAFT_7106 [Olpidium bornovanus]|uniref:Cysteine dioxygenase n=1 Tax=Olpidium bornovanus TaxID=278681 RepID=A0A8H7ZX85_9FUNG|nr:MAG: hypothetical protein BJ554DRAFT_7106 [Olpidium bornovanus]
MKVLDGALIEETFEWPETDAGKPCSAFRNGDNVSPISDHSSDSDDVCAVIDGNGETVKLPPTSDNSSDSDDVCAIAGGPRAMPCGLKKKWVREYNRDEVAYIHDKIGLHRVANSSASKPAVSLQ